MMHSTIDAFPEPLSRDLAFILGLDGLPASADALATRSSSWVAGSAAVGFSTSAALMVGAVVMVVSYWPTISEDATPTSPSLTPYSSDRSAPKIITPLSSRSARLDADPGAVSISGDEKQLTIVARTPAAQAVSPAAIGRISVPMSLSARLSVSDRVPSRKQTQIVAVASGKGSDRAGVADFMTTRTNQTTAEVAGVDRSPIEAGASTSLMASSARASAPALGLPGTPVTMNPAPVSITNLRAARRDAQDALVGLRRQL